MVTLVAWLTESQILRKQFGLEAFFAHTRKACNDSAPWTKDSSHKWHDEDELETTICYLTLPRKAAGQRTYSISQEEADSGENASINGAVSSPVGFLTLANKEAMSKQFKRALRTLQLQPYLHPSQWTETVLADARQEEPKGAEADQKGESEQEQEERGEFDHH